MRGLLTLQDSTIVIVVKSMDYVKHRTGIVEISNGFFCSFIYRILAGKFIEKTGIEE
jgi:hypothetical protein